MSTTVLLWLRTALAAQWTATMTMTPAKLYGTHVGQLQHTPTPVAPPRPPPAPPTPPTGPPNWTHSLTPYQPTHTKRLGAGQCRNANGTRTWDRWTRRENLYATLAIGLVQSGAAKEPGHGWHGELGSGATGYGAARSQLARQFVAVQTGLARPAAN